MTKILFTAADAGCYLSGTLGWHNTYRVVDLAEAHGFHVGPSEREFLDAYRESVEIEDESGATPFDVVGGQGGLADAATEFLREHTEDGLDWIWDDGLCLMAVDDDGEPIF